jgi:hypothetical protein
MRKPLLARNPVAKLDLCFLTIAILEISHWIYKTHMKENACKSYIFIGPMAFFFLKKNNIYIYIIIFLHSAHHWLFSCQFFLAP